MTDASSGRLGVAHQLTNLAAVVIPLLAFALAIVMLCGRLVEWMDLAVLAEGYAATCLGITVGFHRLLTHRSFQTYPAVRYAVAVLGSLAVEGSVLKWVADHRSITPSATRPVIPTARMATALGCWAPWAGCGTLTSAGCSTQSARPDRRRYARDLLEDRGMRRIDAAEKPLILASLAFPFLLGWLVKGSLGGALVTLVWGGLARVFLLHHATFSINSICHFFGRRRFATRDRSTNVAWLSLATFGESWHNNHHAFPTSAFHGLRRRELDIGGVFIRALEAAGLAWQVVRIAPECQREKAAPGMA